MSRKLSTDIYSPNGKLSFIIQHPETSIHYLSQLQNKFRPRKIDKNFVDPALIGAEYRRIGLSGG